MDEGRFSAAEGANNAQPDTENLIIINVKKLQKFLKLTW